MVNAVNVLGIWYE